MYSTAFFRKVWTFGNGAFSLLNSKSLNLNLMITLGDLAQMRIPQGRCRTSGSEGESLIILLWFWHLELIHDFTWWKGKEPSISQEGCGNRKYFKIALKMWLRYDPEKKEIFWNLTERDKKPGSGPSSYFAFGEEWWRPTCANVVLNPFGMIGRV